MAKNKIKLIDTPIYSYREALYKCFYSLSLYVDVGKRWQGLGLLYLLFVIAIFSIPFACRVTYNLNQSFNDQIVEPLLSLPTAYVQNGALIFDKPMPYFIKNKKNQVVLIVDNTATIDSYTPKYPYLNILITKYKVDFKIPTPQLFSESVPSINPEKPLSQAFGEKSNFAFDGKKIVEENNMKRFKYLSGFLIYPLLMSMFYSMSVLLFLVLGFLGQVFSQVFFSYPIGLKQSCRIFMVASTPMLAFLILMLTVDAMFFGIGYLLLIITIIYYGLAISALKANSQKVVLK